MLLPQPLRLHWIWNCSGSHYSWWKIPLLSEVKWIKAESGLLQAVICKVKLFVDLWCRPTTVSRPHLVSFLVPHTTILHSIWEGIFLRSSAKSTGMYKTGATRPLLEVPDLQSRKKPNCRTRCQSFLYQAGCFRKLLHPTNLIHERRAMWN